MLLCQCPCKTDTSIHWLKKIFYLRLKKNLKGSVQCHRTQSITSTSSLKDQCVIFPSIYDFYIGNSLIYAHKYIMKVSNHSTIAVQ